MNLKPKKKIKQDDLVVPEGEGETKEEGVAVPEGATKITGIRAPEANYREQETEPQVGGDQRVVEDQSNSPEAQPDPVQELIQELNEQAKRIREMEKSQTELLQYLQDKFKNEGQPQGQGDGTLGQLASIADKIMKEDKPPTTDERLSQLALDNMSLMNRYVLKKLLGEDVELEPKHRTV